VELAKFQTTKTVTDMSKVLNLTERPNSLACDGVEIVSTGSAVGSNEVASNIKRGGSGSTTLKYDSFILSANHLQTNVDFRRKAAEGNDLSGAVIVDVRTIDTDFFCSLFTLTNLTGKAAGEAYSICAIQPKDNGAGASAAYNTMPDYGEHRTGGITFPKQTTTDPNYSTYIEAPAMALAHYLWNDVPFSVDPVGFMRPRGDEIEIEMAGLDYDAAEYPPMKLVLTAAGKTKNYVITEVRPSIAGDTTVYKGHTRDV
jgi:hypothetical protein